MGSFLIIEVSGFFHLFLRVIQRISRVISAKLSPCLEKLEISLLSLTISIFVGFYILVILLEKLVPGIDLDISIVLTVLVLLILEVSSVF